MSQVDAPLSLRQELRSTGAAALSASDRWVRTFVRRLSRIRFGACTLVLPGGERMSFAGEMMPQLQATLRIEDAAALRSLFVGGAAGFAEAYMDGHWNSPDLAEFLALALRNEAATGSGTVGTRLVRLLHRLRRLSRGNSRRGCRRNIAHHYDLGNAFYRLWLDASMTYSSALFEAPGQSLEAGQANKYRHLARLLDLRPGLDLLDIGCGWGAFALIAARDYGCRVTAITLSAEQAAWARARVAAAGLAGKVEVRLQDYRDVDGHYDRIASIEMLEAVGQRYWPVYFHTLKRRLRPDGVAALQVITIEDRRFAAYSRNTDFIQRHIFPGGLLPSSSAIEKQCASAGLRAEGRITFGRSYAETLVFWRHAFDRAWPEIATLGFDERFRRMWHYYLAYCEAGFRVGTIDVMQLRLVHR